MQIEKQRVVKVMVWGCDGCKKEIDALVGDEIVQVFHRKLGVKVGEHKRWKTTKKESYHKECYVLPLFEKPTVHMKEMKK